MSRGAVAAGHPETAEAGAWALREGGNAADAAIAAICASLSAENSLTALGAGGHMLVHRPGGGNELLDFFVAAPAVTEREADLIPVEIDFGDTTQIFNIGAASCGIPGTPAGLAEAARRYGSMPLADLVRPGVRLAREGVRINAQQAYLLRILAPILIHEPTGAEIYAPGGSLLAEGDLFLAPELADALERLGADGAEPFYGGEIGERICAWVGERGGILAQADLAAYEPVIREPVSASFAGREVLTNPPPSSGGLLIAFALELLERLGATDTETLVSVMAAAQAQRTEAFVGGLYEEGFSQSFLGSARLDAAAAHCQGPSGPNPGAPGDALGSTTHITAMDADGMCASVTCSNGTGSGLIVPGTGVHVNNMLGEQDLNPFGFHRTGAGRRMPSMMSPTLLLRDGALEAGIGSGGSNRIRSAIVQTIIHLTSGAPAQEAVNAPRVHFEAGVVHAEPGTDPEALRRLEASGYDVVRWQAPNLFFGGVHAVVAGAAGGAPVGGGDPRRGGAVATA